jgi:hypothetical protein
MKAPMSKNARKVLKDKKASKQLNKLMRQGRDGVVQTKDGRKFKVTLIRC